MSIFKTGVLVFTFSVFSFFFLLLFFLPIYPFSSSSSFQLGPMSRQSSSEQQPRRVKVTLACIVCRKKKVKCDGVQPSCSRCKNSGTHCEYSDRPRKRGPPKGYVEVIENRAHRIETLLGNKKIDPRYVSSSPPTAAIASPTTAGNYIMQNIPPHARTLSASC